MKHKTESVDSTADPADTGTSAAKAKRYERILAYGRQALHIAANGEPPRLATVAGVGIGLIAIGGTLWWVVSDPPAQVPTQTAAALSIGLPAASMSGSTSGPALPRSTRTTTPPNDAAKATPTSSQSVPLRGTRTATAAATPNSSPAMARSDTPPVPQSSAIAGKPNSEPTPTPAARAPAGAPPLPPRTGAIADEALSLLKLRAGAGETDAMEELARRYIKGVGVKIDLAEGTKWLQRAAGRGAPSAMFNIGVMYERGLVFEKDPAKALEWYTKASAVGVPMATHNMALMYREGAGIPADHKRAHKLLLAAARQGMSASMFALGSMYEGGTHGLKKNTIEAIVWYAMAMQFQRASSAPRSSDLAQEAEEKVNELQRVLSYADLRRAQTMGEREFDLIIATMRAAAAPPDKSSAGPQVATAPDTRAPPSAPAPASTPLDPKERLVEIQKMLAALRLYTGKPDGLIGPMTRSAIRSFQRMIGVPQTGEPSQELADALRERLKVTTQQ